ncbi:hypothetical protein BJ166DRAFT_506831 [Pestalotiopsis sp. NC0098]|nr:hypothetical protein BJ166DRAFT_506831 [Pestalotiopsis sp. NC0098]
MGRRKADDNVDDPDALSAAALAKRQRVSMACDRCRSAKSKCNGDQPCSSCDNQMKPCVYTHTARKRGIPTGYLKSVESCMAWLFEKYPGSEEALRRQLRNNNRKNGKRILLPRAEGADQLRRRWAKSCISGDIVNLLSEPEAEPDASLDYTEASGDNSPANHLSEPESASITPKGIREYLSISQEIDDKYAPRHEESTSTTNRHLTLPRDWKRLIDVFFNYTSCWLPLVSHEQVVQTASRYHPHGLVMNLGQSSALDAELWAVLAVASFHSASSETPSGTTDLSPGHIYAVASHLSVLNNDNIELPHIRALLLQSLLLLGQKKTIEAWALVSKASRLALSKVTGPTVSPANIQSGLQMDGELSQIIAASFILDTLASLSLGRAEVAVSAFLGPPFNLSDRLLMDMNANDPAHRSTQSDSNAVFQQLYIFCRLWLLHQSPARRVPSTQDITVQNLLQNLDGRFSFCNSLVLDISNPAPPFKFLLQAMFLSISLDMASGPRPALLLNLLELIETNLQAPNILSIPPLTTTIMSIAGRHIHSTQVFGDIQTRWDAAFKSVHGKWRISETCHLSVRDSSNIGHDSTSPRVGEIAITIFRAPRIQSGTLAIPETPNLANIIPPKLIGQHLPQPDAQGDGPAGLTTLPSSETRAPNSTQDKENETYSEPLHDLLEELGSVDYADATNADSFFLSNLGFGPECNLEDFFPSDLMTGLE